MADESKPPLYEDLHCDNEDAEKKAAYLLYPDGHREYVDKPPEGESASIRWTCAAKSGTMGVEIYKGERTNDHDIYFRTGQQAAEKAE